MAFVTDTFNEGGDIELSLHVGETGAAWTDHPHASYTTPFSIDDTTRRIYSTGTAAYYASGVPPSADYSVEADFFLASAISQNIAVCARMHATDDTMYFARLNNGTAWQLFKRITGTSTQLGGDSTNQLPSVGNSATGRLVVQGDQISFYVNGVLEIGPITDTDITAVGRAGVRNAGTASATTGIHLDNLGAAELGVNAGVALFRGRNFPFFDDDEVNRFEFWPAVTAGATEHERAAAIGATGSVTVAGEFFSVFTCSVVVSANASIETAAQFFTSHERSVAASATADISVSGSGFSTLERSASLSATATVESSGARVVERSASISATADISTSGEVFSVVERAVAVSATGTIEISAQFFTEFAATVSLSAAAAIIISGNRVVERSASLSAAATVTISGESFTIVERACGFVAVADIAVSGSIGTASTYERSVSLNATATMTIAGGIVRPTPSSRTFVINSPMREYSVPRSNRVFIVSKPDREEVAQ